MKHEAFSNRIFAEGAVQASIWLAEQSAGSYQLEDLFEPREEPKLNAQEIIRFIQTAEKRPQSKFI